MADVLPQINAFDIQGLHQLNSKSISKTTALKEAAEQFESIFVRQLLSSMRKVNDLFKQDSIFDSDTTDFYQNMWDDQISINLSKGSLGGISDLLVQQLGGTPSQQLHEPKQLDRIQPAQQLQTLTPVELKITEESLQDKNHSDLISGKKITQQSPGTDFVSEPEKFSSPQAFIDFIKPLVIRASEALGIKPQLIVAQSALETGWGQFIIQSKTQGNSRNLFNIKDRSDWHGKTVATTTVEFDGVELKQQRASFRVYDNFKQSIDDFIKFLSSDDRYKSLINSGNDSELYLHNLQKSGYATDPDYAKKISRILKSDIIQENFKGE
ncbi:MAG TPA: flagellar assembly peptidoglycan hydrolase FlgJ [Aeromonadales bacterium]|nr:flagellar assembly peptidoglycan hydrolase FlgJ [Aeromonadales bacterium]